LADKLAPLIINALRKAAVDRAGLLLFAGRSEPGLFPASALGKQAADRACAAELLRRVDGHDDRWTITPAGTERLREETSPRQILEDCVRALESRQDQISELQATLDGMFEQMQGLRSTIEQLLPSMSAGGEPPMRDAGILTALNRWQADAAEDCPLPELFQQAELLTPGITIGQFHDALRRLHDAERVYLHPWTGPLYDMPEPRFALLIGHEIAYYASGRRLNNHTDDRLAEAVGSIG
jgi:hypothetical protein